jgi:hypothetical protein
VNGDLYVVNNLDVDGKIETQSTLCADALTPYSSGSSIGTSSNRWNALYVKKIDASGDCKLSGQITMNYYGDGSTTGDTVTALTISASALIKGGVTSGWLIVNGATSARDIVPQTDAVSSSTKYSLGTSTMRWNVEGNFGNFYGGLWSKGNITANGAITALSTSDIRLKANIHAEDYAERLLSLGAVVDYNYNELAYQVRGCNTTTRHTGLIYQQAVTAGIDNLCSMGDDGYGYVNLLSTDFLATMAGALQQTIRRQLTFEQSVQSRIAQLENEINKLKAMI